MDAEGNITAFWDQKDGAEWDVEFINVENSTVAKRVTVVQPQAVITADEIRAMYGYLTIYVVWRVRPRRADGASNNQKQFGTNAIT